MLSKKRESRPKLLSGESISSVWRESLPTIERKSLRLDKPQDVHPLCSESTASTFDEMLDTPDSSPMSGNRFQGLTELPEAPWTRHMQMTVRRNLSSESQLTIRRNPSSESQLPIGRFPSLEELIPVSSPMGTTPEVKKVMTVKKKVSHEEPPHSSCSGNCCSSRNGKTLGENKENEKANNSSTQRAPEETKKHVLVAYYSMASNFRKGKGPAFLALGPPAGSNRLTEGSMNMECEKKTSINFVMSIGSEQHEEGECAPCIFFHTSTGCKSGKDCKFCHLCEKGEVIRRRKAEKKRQRRREEREIRKNARKNLKKKLEERNRDDEIRAC